MLFDIYKFLYFCLYLYISIYIYNCIFYIFVLRSYCNAQLKIDIDNCAIEINKLIIKIIIHATMKIIISILFINNTTVLLFYSSSICGEMMTILTILNISSINQLHHKIFQ